MEIRETKNFKTKEIAVSPDYPHLAVLPTDKNIIKNINYTLEKAQIIRDDIEKPMIILSFYRNDKLNKAVKGAIHSQHKDGTAFDFTIKNTNMKKIADLIHAKKYQFIDKIIYYPKNNFVHLTILPNGRNQYWEK